MRGLERNTACRVRQAVLRVAETGHGDVVKMRGYDREWRLRVGVYRVRLTFEFPSQTIRVLRVRHRREAYLYVVRSRLIRRMVDAGAVDGTSGEN